MSRHKQSPTLDPHAPIREAESRPSASGPGDRIAAASDVAIYLREDCRTLRDSLQLEMVAAQYCLQIRDVRTPTGVPVGEVVAAEMVIALEGERDPLSYAILRALAHVGLGDLAKRSGEAAARIRDVGRLRQFADVGKVVPTGAWRATDAVPGEETLIAEFEHERGRRHTVAVFVEPRRGGMAKHLGLLGPAHDVVEPGCMLHPDAMESLEIPVAGERLREVLERVHGSRCAATDDFRALIAAARARSMLSEPSPASEGA